MKEKYLGIINVQDNYFIIYINEYNNYIFKPVYYENNEYVIKDNNAFSKQFETIINTPNIKKRINSLDDIKDILGGSISSIPTEVLKLCK